MTFALLPQVPEWALNHWHPSEKAMYPDYFAKREQWKQLRMQSWDKEVSSVSSVNQGRMQVNDLVLTVHAPPFLLQVAQLQAETPASGPKTEALPPARKEGDLPPLWWQFVTRARERPT